MSGSVENAKPVQTGLVDMGNISFYDEPGVAPPFNISDLSNYPGSFSEIVLNVTWAELQPTANGPLDTSSIDSAIAEDGAVRGEMPSDLVTSSGSGLDPHLSPASDGLQVAREARARGLPQTRGLALVARHTQGRTLGFRGEPRANVLLSNLALDSLASGRRR